MISGLAKVNFDFPGFERWIDHVALNILNGQAYLVLRAQATSKHGDTKMSATFLNAATTTLRHTISETEKSSYVVHINSYLADDKFLKKYLPLDPATDSLFDLIKDGVLLWYVFILSM